MSKSLGAAVQAIQGLQGLTPSPSAISRITAIIRYVFFSIIFGSAMLYTHWVNHDFHIWIFGTIIGLLLFAGWCALRYRAYTEKWVLTILIPWGLLLLLWNIFLWSKINIVEIVCFIYIEISMQLFFWSRILKLNWLIKQNIEHNKILQSGYSLHLQQEKGGRI
jgi:hypothetical protein